MKLALVIPSLGCGGAERVLSIMAGCWAESGWEVTLLTLAGPDVPVFFSLHPAVRLRPLDIWKRASYQPLPDAGDLRRLRVLRTAILDSGAEVVLSFIDGVSVATLAATLGLGIPVVASERLAPGHPQMGRFRRVLQACLYWRAARVVVQTEEGASQLVFVPRSRVRVIANPVLPAVSEEPTAVDAPVHSTEKVVIGAGRLAEQKGFDIAISAFARLAAKHPGWSLVLWGEGPMRASLERQRDDAGLRGRVLLPGTTHALAARMRAADLFVLSSRFEGFPNVLAEAMACGLPVVSFDCPTGPRDLVRPEVDGLLVSPGDAGALSQALDRLMSSEEDRRRLAARAPEVVERFSLQRVMAQWNVLLEEVAAGA